MMSRCHDIITHTIVQGWYVIDDPEAYTGSRVQSKMQSCFHSKKFTGEHARAREVAITPEFRLKHPLFKTTIIEPEPITKAELVWYKDLFGNKLREVKL